MKTEDIQDFILKSERNLNIAAAVSDAWLQARSQLVSQFFKRLEVALRGKMKGWECELRGEFFNEAYASFMLSKASWKDRYCVSLECYKFGQKMIFGIWRNEETLNGLPFSEELLALVKKYYPSARARTEWEADITMHVPAKDWRTLDVLWRIHTDEKFLEEVAGQLVEIAKLSEPVLDQLVRKK